MDGANFWNAPSIDHLGDGIFCAIYRFPTHVVKNNLFSSSLAKFSIKIAMNLGYVFFFENHNFGLRHLQVATAFHV